MPQHLYQDDLIRESIDAQRKVVKQDKEQFEYFIALDDKGMAMAYFREFAQQNATLHEMERFADLHGIAY